MWRDEVRQAHLAVRALLAAHPSGLTRPEIRRMLGLSLSSCARIVRPPLYVAVRVRGGRGLATVWQAA